MSLPIFTVKELWPEEHFVIDPSEIAIAVGRNQANAQGIADALNKIPSLEYSIRELEQLLAHKNDTTNTFMAQVKKLQAEVAEWKQIADNVQKSNIQYSDETARALTERDATRAELAAFKAMAAKATIVV